MKVKCPYCGHESEQGNCEHCKAWIPPQDEPKEESERTSRRKNKEMN